jgi:hypothetical protein
MEELKKVIEEIKQLNEDIKQATLGTGEYKNISDEKISKILETRSSTHQTRS